MTTALDSVLAPVAAKFINQFGTTVRYTSKTLSAYNTTTGVVDETIKNAEMKAIIDSVRRRTSETGQGDTTKRLTMAASSFVIAPTEGDTVVLNKVSYIVDEVDSNYSGDDVATYELSLRR
jgi:hypothetical protein